MARWTELMFRSTGVVIDAETKIADDFTPSQNATLVGTFVICGGIAATTLIENGHFKMTHKGWGGREHYTPFNSIGLETVPHASKGVITVPCSLPVTAAIPVKCWYYNNVAPTTPEFTVYGIFEG